MTISETKIYPRTGDKQTVYLKSVVKNPNIIVGDYTMYNDFVNDPTDFEKNNVLYHYPINHDRLIIGKFCSIACGAKFIFTSANHTLKSLSTYPFPLFFEEWGLDKSNVTDSWDNKGDIVIGNDVWIGYEAGFMIIFGKDERVKFEEIRETLSDPVCRQYDEATTYRDGKWVMFEPTDTYEFDDYMKLLAIKRKPNRK